VIYLQLLTKRTVPQYIVGSVCACESVCVLLNCGVNRHKNYYLFVYALETEYAINDNRPSPHCVTLREKETETDNNNKQIK